MAYNKDDFTMTINDYMIYVDIAVRHHLPILERHHNMSYKVIYSLCDTIILVYSYQTLVGFISQNDRIFYEWGRTGHYSKTTSKQLTILANELKRYYSSYGVHMISITDGKTLLGSGIFDTYRDYFN